MATTFGHYRLQENGDIWIWKTVEDFSAMNVDHDVHVVLQGDASENFMDEMETHGVDIENYPDADISSEHIESFFRGLNTEKQSHATTIQELVDLLQKVEDKSQTVHVWNRFGYYGTGLTLEVATDQEAKPLIIECDE